MLCCTLHGRNHLQLQETQLSKHIIPIFPSRQPLAIGRKPFQYLLEFNGTFFFTIAFLFPYLVVWRWFTVKTESPKLLDWLRDDDDHWNTCEMCNFFSATSQHLMRNTLLSSFAHSAVWRQFGKHFSTPGCGYCASAFLSSMCVPCINASRNEKQPLLHIKLKMIKGAITNNLNQSIV